MSRIGVLPITIPEKVTVTIDGHDIVVKGPKGELGHTIPPLIDVEEAEDGRLVVKRSSEEGKVKALHGLTRALVANMVTGVSDGFRRTLQIDGVGYQAEMRGSDLVLKLGYSHEIVMSPPDDNTSFDVPKDGRGRVVHVDGIDKQVVGQMAANIRYQRPPEPYKGKGVRYAEETIRFKAGKSGK